MARMQKAAAIMQFKLEGQTHRPQPRVGLDHRRLLHRIDPQAGTIEIDGVTLPRCKDRTFPTLDPARPVRAVGRGAGLPGPHCSKSFLASQKLWEHMRFLVGRGSM